MIAASPRAFFGKSRKPAGPKPPPTILFQKYFKSVGPRTYAAQVKKAANGNHFLVLTEGKRDEKTNEVKKSCVYLYSEDFTAFFAMLKETAQFMNANPVDLKVKAKMAKIWAKKAQERPEPPQRAEPQQRSEPEPVGA